MSKMRSDEQSSIDDNPLHDIPIEVIVSVGKAKPLVRDLLRLEENAIVPLDRRIEDPVELYVGDRLIARGQLQELEGGEPGQFAIKLTAVVTHKGELH